MPNTPLMVFEGITGNYVIYITFNIIKVIITMLVLICTFQVYCRDESTAGMSDAESIVNYMFSQLGLCEKIPESLMNSVGGLSGSGPAYVYFFIFFPS